MTRQQSKVIQVVRGVEQSDGAGVKLKRIIGQRQLRRLDPFLMLDEFGSDHADDYIAGFPPHPHRGFQTVTYMLQGKMGHKDSVGNQGVIEDGGLQWMNAGSGIIHEEMPQQTEGKLRGFQLWVNLPADEKMSAPGYEDIQSKQVPELFIDSVDNNSLEPPKNMHEPSKIRVLAGEYNGVKGPIKTHAVSPHFLDFHLKGDANVAFKTSHEHQGFVYVYEGVLNVGDHSLNSGDLGVLAMSDELVLHNQSAGDAKAIFVSGLPLNEPVAQYGPFVMNTEAEIQQALKDYQQGTLARTVAV